MVTAAASVLGTLLLVTQASAQGRGEGRGLQAQAGDGFRGAARGGGEMRGARRGGTRATVNGNVRARGDARAFGDARVRNVDRNVRAEVRGNRRDVRRGQAWRGDRARWRDARWRNRGWGGPSFSIGIGVGDPYYSYAYAGPYGYGGYSDAYSSYAASPGCTCPPRPYARYNTSWDWGARW